jgi:hypothetical protein
MVEAQSAFQILQPEGPAEYVIMIWEYMHNYRIIPTDGRPHVLPANVPLFAGDPKGHWEGDVLVVDNTNQNARTWFDIAANFHSEQIHVLERFTPMDENRIGYEALIEDPKVYTRPWKAAFNINRNLTAGYRNMEFSCWEGEHEVTEKYTLESQGAHPKNLPKKITVWLSVLGDQMLAVSSPAASPERTPDQLQNESDLVIGGNLHTIDIYFPLCPQQASSAILRLSWPATGSD